MHIEDGKDDNRQGKIRKFNLAHDLDPVADLIELCFPIHQDPDGQTYIKEMRKAARDMRFVGLLSSPTELEPSRNSGFVWEENGKIYGNLSLITLQQTGQNIYLVANVAVHPRYRRRGIAKKLTQHALAYLDGLGEKRVWLQVREDNEPAIHLYRSMKFVEQARRTTWRIRPVDFYEDQEKEVAHVIVRPRVRSDWKLQKTGLDEAYPGVLRWNLPVSFRRFTPGFSQNFSNIIDGAFFKHWTVSANGYSRGVITWQKTNTFANNLWLAFPGGQEEQFLYYGLKETFRSISKRHPLSIDYPHGRCEELFQSLGFDIFRTLIWMSWSG